MSDEPDELARLATRYRRFATDEAQGVSPHYERLARDIAESADVLRFLSELPPPRRQPNLLLGAATLIAGRPTDIAMLIDMIASRADELRATMLRRTTQTNEPARCAVLLPAAGRAAAAACPYRSGRVGRPLPAARPLRLRLGARSHRARRVPARLFSAVL